MVFASVHCNSADSAGSLSGRLCSGKWFCGVVPRQCRAQPLSDVTCPRHSHAVSLSAADSCSRCSSRCNLAGFISKGAAYLHSQLQSLCTVCSSCTNDCAPYCRNVLALKSLLSLGLTDASMMLGSPTWCDCGTGSRSQRLWHRQSGPWQGCHSYVGYSYIGCVNDRQGSRAH